MPIPFTITISMLLTKKEKEKPFVSCVFPNESVKEVRADMILHFLHTRKIHQEQAINAPVLVSRTEHSIRAQERLRTNMV